jgi:hypothetical protein
MNRFPRTFLSTFFFRTSSKLSMKEASSSVYPMDRDKAFSTWEMLTSVLRVLAAMSEPEELAIGVETSMV